MKINKKIKEINVDNFIEQYLKACGIENVEGYLNPDVLFFDDPLDYVNINEAIKKLIALRREKEVAQLKAKKQQSSKNSVKKDIG